MPRPRKDPAAVSAARKHAAKTRWKALNALQRRKATAAAVAASAANKRVKAMMTVDEVQRSIEAHDRELDAVISLLASLADRLNSLVRNARQRQKITAAIRAANKSR